MSKIVKIICLLLAVISFPLVLMMAGFAPMLTGGGMKGWNALQKAAGSGLVILIMAIPFWVLFFGWRTISTWRSDSNTSALLMAGPALIAIAVFAYANLSSFGP